MNNSKSLDHLHPDIRMKCEHFLMDCKESGFDIRVTHTWRSPAYQDKLYAQGRTAPGKRVTNATSKTSKHCFTINNKPASKAFDIGVFSNGVYVTDGGDIRYKKAGQIGKALGLTWGGDFKSIFDPGHFEIV